MAKKAAGTLSLPDLINICPTEAAAIRYMERIRWGNTPYCARCGAADKVTPQRKKIGNYWCGWCRQYFNVKTGTPLEHSRVRDVRKWIYASYLLMASRKGISATRLKHEIKVSYPTAWYMLHRLGVAHGTEAEALRDAAGSDEIYMSDREENNSLFRSTSARQLFAEELVS